MDKGTQILLSKAERLVTLFALDIFPAGDNACPEIAPRVTARRAIFLGVEICKTRQSFVKFCRIENAANPLERRAGSLYFLKSVI